MGLDTGAGVVVMVYPLVGGGVGGVHPMVTTELKLPFTKPAILTSPGGRSAKQQYKADPKYSDLTINQSPGAGCTQSTNSCTRNHENTSIASAT